MNKTLDTSGIIGYDNNNDDINVEIVKMDEQRPINNPECEHLLVRDESDRIGNTVSYMCIKPHCGFGQFFPDDEILK